MVSEDTDGGSESVPPSRRSLDPLLPLKIKNAYLRRIFSPKSVLE